MPSRFGVRTSIQCDGICPQPHPYKCGGLETMVRDVVVATRDYGVICPPLERSKKGNHFKCPVAWNPSGPVLSLNSPCLGRSSIGELIRLKANLPVFDFPVSKF